MARRAWSQLMDGTVEDFSHGFMRHDDRPHETRKGVREIMRATMQEISPCARGSIPGARAVSVRSQQQT
jgi:phage head maturation protease